MSEPQLHHDWSDPGRPLSTSERWFYGPGTPEFEGATREPERIGGALAVGVTGDPRTPITVPVHNPATGQPVIQLELEREEVIELIARLTSAVAQTKPSVKPKVW